MRRGGSGGCRTPGTSPSAVTEAIFQLVVAEGRQGIRKLGAYI